MIDTESKDSETNFIYPPGKNPMLDGNPYRLKESCHQSDKSFVTAEPLTDEGRPDPTFPPEEYTLVVMSLICRRDIENAVSRNRRRKRMILSDDDDDDDEYGHGVKLPRHSTFCFIRM